MDAYFVFVGDVNNKHKMCALLSGFTTSDRLRRSFHTAFRVQAALTENGSLAWTLPQGAIFDGFITLRVTQCVVKQEVILMIIN